MSVDSDVDVRHFYRGLSFDAGVDGRSSENWAGSNWIVGVFSSRQSVKYAGHRGKEVSLGFHRLRSGSVVVVGFMPVGQR